MSNNKPGVVPTKEQIESANNVNTNQNVYNVSDLELAAANEMKRRTEEQMKLKEDNSNSDSKSQFKSTYYPNGGNNNGGDDNGGNNNGGDDITPKPNNPSNVNLDSYIDVISQPNYNQAFDVIPLPSEGKTYPMRNKTVKVAFMTTADENILTSPNLVESGKFLEILINRKLLEPGLRYKDLLPGDRDAIMLWLRATAYGEMYPVMLYDGDTPFETEIDLNTLKTVNFTVEPDNGGRFSFTLPLSKKVVTIKLLNLGEIEEVSNFVEGMKENIINEENSILLKKQIVAIDGVSDVNEISDFVDNMRLMDATKLREFIASIEVGIDMNVTVETPGGESLTTFLPITPRFFWPNAKI